MKRMILATATLLLALFGSAALAAGGNQQGAKQFGDYVIHFNAVNTDFLTPQVARSYGIRRSKNRILLTVSVLRGKLGVAGEPVEANVEAWVTNLNQQTKNVKMKEVKDGGAIYYIGTFSATNEETFDIHVKAQPKGSDKAFEVSFRRKFYTN
ncbi:MAG: DUF4426 domain-containing protein [Gammaproteobacteria bacterium]|nr:MAG: DUF4426 domain-containing protein [Gammaproteobacteria bacterium]